MEKETVHRTYSSWTRDTCKPNICFLPFYSSMASQFFSPSIFTVVGQWAIWICIILWSFPMFLVLFTSQAADNQLLPDVLGIKAEWWAGTAEDSWDKHCLGIFGCIFYFIYVNKPIQNHSLTARDEKQWANQPSSTWKTRYLIHDFETHHQDVLRTSCCEFSELYCSCLCCMRFPQSALLNLHGQILLLRKVRADLRFIIKRSSNQTMNKTKAASSMP